ncbi:MAG: hypothetical protein WC969_10780 [Elusimicrobiota bacterium]|jgi:hypothetical protein
MPSPAIPTALLLLALPAFAGEDAPAPYAAADAPAAVRPDEPLSAPLREALRHVDAELQRTETGRRLLAETGDVLFVERRRTGLGAVRYVESPRREFLVDAERAPELEALDFEILFVRERRRAAARCPVPLLEDELAAHQESVAYVVEKASVDPAFSRKLRAAYERAERIFRSRRADAAAALKAGAGALPPWRAPREALALAGAELFLFSEDPYRLYAALEDALPWPAETVRLTELEDFLAQHSARLDALDWRSDGRYALVDGRPYPGRVARAALVVRGREGLARLKEGLGPFESVLRENLRLKANRWIREGK